MANHRNLTAALFFLTEIQMVNDLIETELIIKDTFVPVLPLLSPSKKVVLSNVPRKTRANTPEVRQNSESY